MMHSWLQGESAIQLTRAFKKAFRVGLSSCLVAALSGTWSPAGHLHLVSAGITVVIVMEMGSIERLWIKGLHRGLGTILGAIQSVAAIKLVEMCRNEPLVAYVSILLVIVTNSTLQLLHSSQSYIHLASNITFVFVFYGYFNEDGAEAIVNRILSVFAGILLSFLVDLIWPLLWLDNVGFSVRNVVT